VGVVEPMGTEVLEAVVDVLAVFWVWETVLDNTDETNPS